MEASNQLNDPTGRMKSLFISTIVPPTCYILLFTLLFLQFTATQAQDSTARRPNYRALHRLLAGEAIVYAGSVYGLSKAWYKTPFNKFQVNDDWNEWLQMDKVGHFYSAYQISRHTAALYRQTGVTPKQAALYGAMSGFLFLTPIEILDGFQYPEYGFSPSDMAANVLGPTLYLTQFALWNEERIIPKFSFHPTSLAAVRPELLGQNLSEQWLKDYNGQSYWLSANVRSFFPKTQIPAWLNVAVGYGMQNMVGAEITKSRSLGYEPQRQFYLSLDVDFRRIPTQKKWLKTLFFMLNSVKIPAPTLEISQVSGWRFYPFYY
jgi:Predicted periplasmic lipoprotein (DUF2279)